MSKAGQARGHDRLLFDGDAAGRKAARRAMEACLPFAVDNTQFKFLFCPSNMIRTVTYAGLAPKRSKRWFAMRRNYSNFC